MALTLAEKVDENRVRRMARRQGLMLQKTNRRDRRAVDYGMYRLVLPEEVALSEIDRPYGLTLDGVEETLTRVGQVTTSNWLEQTDLDRLTRDELEARCARAERRAARAEQVVAVLRARLTSLLESFETIDADEPEG